MEKDIQNQNMESLDITHQLDEMYNEGDVQLIQMDTDNNLYTRQDSGAGVSLLEREIEMRSLEPDSLNVFQRRAYEIITQHLHSMLSGNNPKPLRMVLYGEGGTGKSKVIQAVTDAFIKAGRSDVSDHRGQFLTM
jgi:Cdc6-like AAA superfamily ATPase